MKNTWNFEDILDFSYFFRLDSEREENTELKLHQRDRQFFLDAQQTDDKHGRGIQAAFHFVLDTLAESVVLT